MKKISVLLILVMLCLCAAPMSVAFAASADLDLGDPSFSTAAKYTFPELNVTATKKINTVVITVDNGSINMPAISGANVYSDPVNRTFVVNYDSTQSPSDIEAMLRSVQFTCDSGKTQHVEIELQDSPNVNIPNNAIVNVLMLNGDIHYYMFVLTANDIGWVDAYNNAKQIKLMGHQGYLVTITCEEEENLLDNYATWYGAWCAGIRNSSVDDADHLDQVPATQGDINNYYWSCGPEAGTYINGQDYTHWNSGEPNGPDDTQCCIMIHHDGKGWNDAPAVYPYIKRYFVEFGGYPEGDPHNPGDTYVIASDKADVTSPCKAYYDLIDEAAEKAKKVIDSLDNIGNSSKGYYMDMIDYEVQNQKKKLDDTANEDDIKKIVSDVIANVTDIVDEPVAASFLLKYNIDPSTQDLISKTDQITPANAAGIVAGKRAWNKLTPAQKEYVNKYLENSTWPELYRYAYELVTPKTGDNTNMPLIALLMLVSMTGIAVATIAKRRFN